MIKTIQIKDAINSYPDGVLKNISGVDINGNVVTENVEHYANERKLAGILAVGGNEGLLHNSFKYLGVKKGDGIGSVMLIAPFSEEKQQMRGIIGRIYIMRGSSANRLNATLFDVIVVKAFLDPKLYSSSNSYTAVTCIYNGRKYLALNLNNDSLFEVYFSGIYSGDCVFQHVLASDVQFS